MSNQEMQFADPDWKPSQQLGMKTSPQEQETYNPQPINADPREQSREKIAPPQQDVYAGLPPYAGVAPRQSTGGQYGQRQYRRRARSPLFWIILAFIIISLMGGGFGSAFNRGFGPPDFGRMGQVHPIPAIVEQQSFTVTGTPTVVINGDNGIINVHTGANASSVIVQDTKNPGPFGDAKDLQVIPSQQGNTITFNLQGSGQGSVDFDVTVPQGANLQLTTTGSGEINLTVPADSAFHLNASTNSGSINTSDFPSVNVNQGGTQATGNVGTVSPGHGATVTLNTDSGDINLYPGS